MKRSERVADAVADILSWATELLKSLPEQPVLSSGVAEACSLCGTFFHNFREVCPECGSGNRTSLKGWTAECIPSVVTKSVCRSLDLAKSIVDRMPRQHLRWAVQLVRDWASILCSMSHRIWSCAVSPPLLVSSHLCVWVISEPTWTSPSQTSVSQSGLPVAGVSTVEEIWQETSRCPLILGPDCRSCRQPLLFSCEVSLPFDWSASVAKAVCVSLAGISPTKEQASRSVICHGSITLHDTLLVSAGKRISCSHQPAEEPWTGPFVVSARQEEPPSHQRLKQQTESKAITFMTLNCGGAMRKIPDVISLAESQGADAVALQELWEGFDPSDFFGTRYCVVYDEVRERAAGLCILLLYRLVELSGGVTSIRRHSIEDALIVELSLASGGVLKFANIYLRPGQDLEVWKHIQTLVAKHKPKKGETMVVGGDFNERLSGHRHGRVARAMAASGCWSFLHVPYQLGQCTNFVVRSGSLSQREIDFVLIPVDSGLQLTAKAVVPGVSTHGAVVCEFSLPENFHYVKNGSLKKFNFRKASPTSVTRLAAHASLFLWLGRVHGLHPDAILEGYHELARGFIPPHVGRVEGSEADVLRRQEVKALLGDAVAAERVKKWKQQQRDQACRNNLGLSASLAGEVAVTGLTSKFFKQKKSSFKVVTQVSRDGKVFCTSPQEFKTEARKQAMELYSLRHLQMDSCSLAMPPQCVYDPSFPTDDLSMSDWSLYCSVRSPFPSQLALEVLGSGSCSAPISREEWDRQCRKGGSEATSRDEFPNAVVKLLSGFATEVVLQWSRQLRTGVHSFFLHAALHLCLLKKEPYWLIRNSRPIILEPDIKRKESSAMFQRFMSRGEATGFIPPWTFSYRKEITPLFLAILVRWFTAYWALNNGHIYCGDWDESNAFCNGSRPSLSEVLQENPSLDVGEWVDWFFSSFQVFLQTPYGLAPPYRMKQGGTQGDSMGVGSYMIPRILRSLALYRKVPAPEHPGLPGVRIPELIFSDDGRLFGLNKADFVCVLNECTSLANDAGASPNASKLQCFLIKFVDGRLVYAADEVFCRLGQFPMKRSGFKIVGVPCVMGECLRADRDKVGDKFRAVRRSITQHRPSCILALRCLMAYAVSSTDFKFTVVPVPAEFCEPLQVTVRQCARTALSLPSWFSDVLLSAPISAGGLGFPVLHVRLSLQRTLVTLQAACSRSVYTRGIVRALLYDSQWQRLPGSDPQVLCDEFRQRGLYISVSPDLEVTEAPVHGAWYRKVQGHHVVAVSDGSATRTAVGCAVVFLDASGVCGAFWCHWCVEDPDAQVAEWFGKLLAVHKAREAGAPKCLFLADCTSAAVNEGVTKSSGSHVLDSCIRSVVSIVNQQGYEEGYVQAQHDSGRSTEVAQAQALAHDLSQTPGVQPQGAVLPLLPLLSLHAVLLKSGKVCLRPANVLLAIYDAEVLASRPQFLSRYYSQAGSAWAPLVLEAKVSNEVIRACVWLRSATGLREYPRSPYCPFCKASVQDWGQHLFQNCLKVCAAVHRAFWDLLQDMQLDGWTVEMQSLTQARVSVESVSFLVRLVHDDHVGQGEGILWVTTSGLIYMPHSMQSKTLISRVQSLSLVFLHTLQHVLWSDSVIEPLQQSEMVPAGLTRPWGLAVFISFMVGAVSSAQLNPPESRPPWVRVVPTARTVVYEPGQCSRDPLSVTIGHAPSEWPRDFRICLGPWTVEWDDIPGQVDLRELAHTLKLA